MLRTTLVILASLLGLLLTAGCGGGPQYGDVNGMVTLDEQPLVGANVTFFPSAADGNPSYGKTNADGRFSLSESEDVGGALVGEYTVRISTFDAGKRDVDPPIPFVPERVPTKYNIQSTLVREVKPGVNEMQFDLDSDGEIMQIDEQDLY